MLLSFGKFPAGIQCEINSPCQNLQFPVKSHILFTNFHVLTNGGRSGFCLKVFSGKTRAGLCLNALKSQNKVEASSLEIDGSDDFDDAFSDIEDDDEFDEIDEEEDEDEVIIPLENMKKWVKNKPRGFGEGKLYDTSVEDKLVEEIEQSRIAQLANVNNLKSNPVKPKPKKEIIKQEKDIPDVVRVRLVNLPKKMNIHRDLQLAFKDIPGLVNIVPVVSGNEKTRDPICRGLAFVDFKKKDDAIRFVQNYSGKSISFGKIQKDITCEMMDTKLPKPAHNESDGVTDRSHRQTLKNLDQSIGESEVTKANSVEQRHSTVESHDNGEIKEILSSSKSSPVEEPQAREESAISKKQSRKLKPEKKKVSTSKPSREKATKLSIPGSANRLKVRDKAMLTGVLSKYGSNATAALTGK